VAEFTGQGIRDFVSGRNIASMDDIRKDIEGFGGITLAALWLFCVR
jgi:hypothetical protein